MESSGALELILLRMQLLFSLTTVKVASLETLALQAVVLMHTDCAMVAVCRVQSVAASVAAAAVEESPSM